MHSVEPATPSDYEQVAAMMAELGAPEAPPPRAFWEAHWMPLTRVARAQGRALGYLYAELHGDDSYARQLVTEAVARRQGVARAFPGRERVREAHDSEHAALEQAHGLVHGLLGARRTRGYLLGVLPRAHSSCWKTVRSCSPRWRRAAPTRSCASCTSRARCRARERVPQPPTEIAFMAVM